MDLLCSNGPAENWLWLFTTSYTVFLESVGKDAKGIITASKIERDHLSEM